MSKVSLDKIGADIHALLNQHVSLEETVDSINKLREIIHELSPFNKEPVDLIRWVPADLVKANDYNPNSVAPPEMRLLETSIEKDGYTQPIVGWTDGGQDVEVIDGFHRNRVGRECKKIRKRIHGYLPVVVANSENTDRSDRIASTVRHNRARGKHAVSSMSELVVELKTRNWSAAKIAKNLGMDEDEVLRLSQISGLTDMVDGLDFSSSWDLREKEIVAEVKAELSAGTGGDTTRIYHTWDKWECYQAGFFNDKPPTGMSEEDAVSAFAEFFIKEDFRKYLKKLFKEWPNSCEHNLTNDKKNRIAWLGQACVCLATGIPAAYSRGFHRLKEDTQEEMNNIALEALNGWLTSRGYPNTDGIRLHKSNDMY